MSTMAKRTAFLAALAVLPGVAILASPRSAPASGPTLQSITTAVTDAEKAIQDIRIEFSCVATPLGEDSDAIKAKYPGRYKPATGVYTKKGDKERLEYLTYAPSSDTDKVPRTIVHDGSNTKLLTEKPDDRKVAKVSAGRWHALRSSFYLNPVLTVSANGDKPLSAELATMDAELVDGTHDVGEISCRLVKLYKKSAKGTILRSFKVYLDPASGYAPVKVETYWYNFLCLERTIEVLETSTVNGVRVATTAKLTSYARPHKSKTSFPLYEKVLTATDVQVNQGVADSTFTLTFPPGTRVWDSTLELIYEIPIDAGEGL